MGDDFMTGSSIGTGVQASRASGARRPWTGAALGQRLRRRRSRKRRRLQAPPSVAILLPHLGEADATGMDAWTEYQVLRRRALRVRSEERRGGKGRSWR